MSEDAEETDFGLIGVLPSVNEIQERINSSFDKLFHHDKNGKVSPYVCSVCDEFLLSERDINWVIIDTLKKNKAALQWNQFFKNSERIPELENQFLFNDADKRVPNPSWLKEVALSPRGVIGRKSNSNASKWGFSCCATCKSAVEKGKTPFYAIVNQNAVGNAPQCLRELTEVELALITPVKGYGYCFSYIGGAQMNLKGTMTFLRVEERKIARAAVHLESMGLTKHIVILLSGKMTPRQRERAKVKQTIRTDYVLAAITWLCANHERWKNVDLNVFRDELEGCTPVVVDQSKEVESENTNVEQRELFKCYYPDGATNERSGGFDDPGAFKQYVDDMQRNNFKVELQLELQKEFVRESDGDLLINTCLLQFPYGRGGMGERRQMHDGTFKDKPNDIESFMRHLSMLSQPIFQAPMFQLIMYSMVSKYRLLRRSRLQLRGEHNSRTLANGLDATDLSSAIRGRRSGNRNAGTNASKTLLSAVDACSKALPHTNEAAKSARTTGESMQHHFGTASIFLTVTFDDENSFLMQVLSGETIDDDTPVSELSDKEVAKRAAERRQLRINFPGLSCLNFEMLFQILCMCVIGWDLRRGEPTDEPGLFGFCEAFDAAMEEQGRTTVHGHCSIWIRGFRLLQRMMFFGAAQAKKRADSTLALYHDRLATTSLFSHDTRTLNSAFDHECPVPKVNRALPTVIDDQTLRHLRHRKGFEATGGVFASCPHCTKTWTYEALLNDYVRHDLHRDGLLPVVPVGDDGLEAEEFKIPKARMQARILEFQRVPDAELSDIPTTCINATYQHHVSCHVKGCFRCQKGKKSTSHKCGPTCECRFKMPDRCRAYTMLKTLSESNRWFDWCGTEHMQPIVEFLPKRSVYDLFQNVSCKAISESKLSCNSNVSLITDGPVGQYQFKYQHKSTQQDDTAEYALVEKSMKGLNGRIHEEDHREALRLICRAAFAHNMSNIVGVPMASYLTRNGSRFYFSHTFTYCPLKDLIRVVNDEAIGGVAQYDATGNMFFENQALHYLCRHQDLEDLNARDFYEQYSTVPVGLSKKRKRDNPILPFIADTGYFQHPSAKLQMNGFTGECGQGSREKEKPTLIKVSQWAFPDTAKFQGSILTCSEQSITRDMEKYAQLVLTLFYPHRSMEDFLTPGRTVVRYTLKLREIYANDVSRRFHGDVPIVFTRVNEIFLQNIQDCAYNSLRYKAGKDDLQSCTEPLRTAETGADDDDDTSPDEEEEPTMPYDFFLSQMGDDVDSTDGDATKLYLHLQQFSFDTLRNTGKNGCGYGLEDHIPVLQSRDLEEDLVGHFVEYMSVQEPDSRNRKNTTASYDERRTYSMTDVVNVLLNKQAARPRKDVFTYNADCHVTNANGSVISIIEWAEAAKLDKIQRRAFECIIAAFLLTFFETHEDDATDATIDRGTASKFRRAKARLMVLRGGGGSAQLICLLHGPGGSGKSTVINLVVCYAREYCEDLGHPFTLRTIIITAMSGVAATLLHGETTHSVLGLNRQKVTDDEIEAWADARLVIVDEVSFATASDFDKMYKHTQEFMRSPFRPFGALNMVFAGDYSQLEPPGRDAVYKGEPCPTFHLALNTFIELDGRHRFRDDPVWGDRLYRIREGEPTLDDIRIINSCCRITNTHKPKPDIQMATYYNDNRDALNASVFDEYCKTNGSRDGTVFQSAVLVLMDELYMLDSGKTYRSINSNTLKRHFWTKCGEASCRFPKGNNSRVDPVLKFFPGCPLMLTENKDVPNGQAKGSRVFLQRIRVKVGEAPMHVTLSCGTTVRAFLASQIKSIRVKHEMTDMVPAQFDLKPDNWSFEVNLPLADTEVNTSIRGLQFPVISNCATTGHKLQGYTATSLYANDWRYCQNWPYVVLSRVRTMAGLFIRHKLTEDLTKYAMPAAMKAMLADFRQRLSLPFIENDEYARLVRDEKSSFYH